MSRYWNYRVLKHDGHYALHEVYYQDGKPDAHTEDAITPCGESAEGLKEEYRFMSEAFDKPVLDAETYEEVEPQVEKPAMKEVADRIRVMTIGCGNQDVMSCEFGNEFGDKVLEYLNEIFGQGEEQ